MYFLQLLRLCVVSILMLAIFSCNTSEHKTTSEKLDIIFKKEGILQIKRAKTDSVIKILDIEIADDDYQTQTGLMYRNSIKDSQGMLFIFPNEIERNFYMKNTRIPLDIIYVSSDKKIVSIQKNAKPFDETSLPSFKPAKYVLEINGGLADSWGLKNEDAIFFSRTN